MGGGLSGVWAGQSGGTCTVQVIGESLNSSDEGGGRER